MIAASLLFGASAVLCPLRARHDGAGGASSVDSTLPAGTWGGDHVRMDVTGRGATFDFDCAHGSVEVPVRVDERGRFSAAGTYVRERPGPIRVGSEPSARPASYSGAVRGGTMTLSVRTTDSDEDVGTYSLELGAPGKVRKCR
jgi:hypothetical protein